LTGEWFDKQRKVFLKARKELEATRRAAKKVKQE